MEEGSSSAAPLISPGPNPAKNRLKRPLAGLCRSACGMAKSHSLGSNAAVGCPQKIRHCQEQQRDERSRGLLFLPGRKIGVVRHNLLERNAEEVDSVPFSGNVGIQRDALFRSAVFLRRERIEHL